MLRNMPELPEVETIRRDLNRELKGRKILKLKFYDWPKMLKPDPESVKKAIEGKKIKDIDPIIEQCVRNLSELSPLKYIKITSDGIIASNQVEGSRDRIPITKPFHPTAIGIHLIYDYEYKTLEFFEINSATKGWAEKMVKAALHKLPPNWKPTVVMDWSDGFWDTAYPLYCRGILNIQPR